MSASRKFSDELRERATRMAVELRRHAATRSGAIRRVAEQLGMHPETLLNWVRQAGSDRGVRPARKVLAELNRVGQAVARRTVERLMKTEGLRAAHRSRPSDDRGDAFRWRASL